jgi:hypothetical protein
MNIINHFFWTNLIVIFYSNDASSVQKLEVSNFNLSRYVMKINEQSTINLKAMIHNK